MSPVAEEELLGRFFHMIVDMCHHCYQAFFDFSGTIHLEIANVFVGHSQQCVERPRQEPVNTTSSNQTRELQGSASQFVSDW